jgi:hypothetical protein
MALRNLNPSTLLLLYVGRLLALPRHLRDCVAAAILFGKEAPCFHSPLSKVRLRHLYSSPRNNN